MSKCKVCKKQYTRERQGQVVCSFNCSLDYVEVCRENKETKSRVLAFRKKKEFLEGDIAHLKKVAQKLFNEFIRLRDKDLPCISCGKIFTEGETTHASHYRPATNSKLRYDERNVYRSCVKCNVFLSSNAIKYREALVIKIGEEVVDELDNTNGIYRYTAEELLSVIAKYKGKVKELKI